MSKVLKKEFFLENGHQVAENLLGKFLVSEKEAKMITEVEVYDGFEDRASHTFKGKTERNKIMFEKGGVFYVYLIYGMHFMLNIVCYKKDYPSAVLIRAVEDVSGPGRVSKCFEIDKKLNSKEISKKSGLWLEDRGIKRNEIQKLPRIGIASAGDWANKPLRFLLHKKRATNVAL